MAEPSCGIHTVAQSCCSPLAMSRISDAFTLTSTNHLTSAVLQSDNAQGLLLFRQYPLAYGHTDKGCCLAQSINTRLPADHRWLLLHPTTLFQAHLNLLCVLHDTKEAPKLAIHCCASTSDTDHSRTYQVPAAITSGWQTAQYRCTQAVIRLQGILIELGALMEPCCMPIAALRCASYG